MKFFKTATVTLALLLGALSTGAAPLAPKQWVEDQIRNATNALLPKADAANTYRDLGDMNIYRATGFSDFEWSSDRQDILRALNEQGIQPYMYDYGGEECDFYLDFMCNGRWYYGYYYGPRDSLVAYFTVYADWFDEETQEYYWDEAYVTGTRKRRGYDKTDIIDEFARNSSVVETASRVTQLENTFNGETKILRTGKPEEYGTGWGYLRQNITGDYRTWRIRVPKWTYTFPAIGSLSWSIYRMRFDANAAAGTLFHYGWKNSTSPTCESYSYAAYVPSNSERYPGYSYYWHFPSTFIANPLTQDTSHWKMKRKLKSTVGAYASDAVEYANYHLKVLSVPSIVDEGSPYYIEYAIDQISRSPMVFQVRPFAAENFTITNREWQTYSVQKASPSYIYNVVNNSKSYYIRPIPEFTTRAYAKTGNRVYMENQSGTANLLNVFASNEVTVAYVTMPAQNMVFTNGFTITYGVVATHDKSWYWAYNDGTGDLVRSGSCDGENTYFENSITFTVNSATSFEDMIVPGEKRLTSADSGLFYDETLDVTFKVSITNGCFYSDIYKNGDWRIGE